MKLIIALTAAALITAPSMAGTIACRNAKGQAAKCGTPGAIPQQKPAAAAAGLKCKDGSTSNAKTRKGACSRHGGIA